jgi:hypothetical protein
MQLMTLWQVIVLYCFAAPLGGSIGAARTLEKGWSIYGIAILVGVLVGASGAWVIWIVFGAARRRSQVKPYRPWQLRAIYLGGAAWACVLAVAGFWLTRTLVYYI